MRMQARLMCLLQQQVDKLIKAAKEGTICVVCILSALLV